MSVYHLPDVERMLKDVERLIRERDGALAEVQHLRERTAILSSDMNTLRNRQALAEHRGYERGVREAAREAELAIFPSKPTIRAILALLEKPTKPKQP